MPTISMFYGILIRMYYAPKEHNPPHIHAYYQDFRSTINIDGCEILEGKLPARQLRLIQAWIEIHQDELLAVGSYARTGRTLFQ